MRGFNWLFLRGLSREQRHWEGFPALFESTAGGKVWCLDLPGTGTEYQCISPWRVKSIVEDLRSRWLKLKGGGTSESPTKWNVLGISLGGMLVQDWLHRYPQDFQAGVLLNSSAADLGAFYERLRLKSAFRLFRLALSKDLIGSERRVVELTTRLDPQDEETKRLIERWADYAKEYPIVLPNRVRQLWAALWFRAPKQLSAPLLVLASKGDQMVSPHCSVRLARRFHAQLWMHPSGGHDLTLDDPRWVAERVRDWLAEVERAGVAKE